MVVNFILLKCFTGNSLKFGLVIAINNSRILSGLKLKTINPSLSFNVAFLSITAGTTNSSVILFSLV